MKKDKLLQEFKLRGAIKRKLLDSERQERQERVRLFVEEARLRQAVRAFIVEQLLLEKDKTSHEMTGINILADLLDKIIPQLEDGYKSLTSSVDQRDSFREHILNAVQNSLAGSRAMDRADLAEWVSPLEEVDVEVGSAPSDSLESDEEKFIDLDGDGVEDSEEVDPRDAFGQGLEGFDSTGRNVAYDVFKGIENQIMDSYSILDSAEDQQVFYDYLLTNLKMYFDRFEEELSPDLEEPQSPDYENPDNPVA